MVGLVHPAVLLVASLALAPTLAFGQASPAPSGAAPKVGVVTTLQGKVTVTRAAAPQPVPLKFKDDVYVQDSIATGDQSIARILLGGKAIVTIRERSLLTVTEVPGRSTIALESDKLAMAVLREKVRPGELVEIRTANAIAAVRGTMLVTEVQGRAQVRAAASPITTSIYVLNDPTGRGVLVTQFDPATRAVIGSPVTLGTLQSFTAVGATPGRVAQILPGQLAQIKAGLEPSGPQHTQAANVDQIADIQMQEAAADLEKAAVGAGSGRPSTLTGPPSVDVKVPIIPKIDIPKIDTGGSSGRPGRPSSE